MKKKSGNCKDCEHAFDFVKHGCHGLHNKCRIHDPNAAESNWSSNINWRCDLFKTRPPDYIKELEKKLNED